MRKNERLGIGLTLVAVASLALMFSVKTRKDKKRQLHEVAEEGYETAHDVLYPLKIQRAKRKSAL